MNYSSQITNRSDLKKEIALLQARVNAHEEVLKGRLKTAPGKIVGSSLGSIAGFLVSRKLASGAWDILKVASSVAFSKTPAGSIKNTVLKNAKALGILAVAKGVVNTIAKRFSFKRFKQNERKQ